MAKKKVALPFNMSEVIRGLLTENPNLTSKEVLDAVLAKYPNAKINEGSFTVAFYTSRKKLLDTSSPKKDGRKMTARTKKVQFVSHPTVDLSTLQTAARFLSEVGGAAAAMEAIKQVQALQVK